VTTSEVTLRDNDAKHRYELLLDGKRAGELVYHRSNGVVTLIHTEIAPKLKGRGLGDQLVAGVLDEIRQRDLLIVPLCPFVQAYLGRHPEDADLVERRT
jgi:uncharacterized protein